MSTTSLDYDMSSLTVENFIDSVKLLRGKVCPNILVLSSGLDKSNTITVVILMLC